MKDFIIPIVFPEYRILLNSPPIDVDLFPWVFVQDKSTTNRRYWRV